MPVCNIDKYNRKVKNNTAFTEQEIDKISELFNNIQDRLDQADDQNHTCRSRKCKSKAVNGKHG